MLEDMMYAFVNSMLALSGMDERESTEQHGRVLQRMVSHGAVP